MPCFVDAEGRRCAVAHLLHRFGEDSLVAEVAATDNHACVSDLANHPAPATAITSVGLMLDRHPGLEFSALSRGTNYAVAPPWLYPVLLSTL